MGEGCVRGLTSSGTRNTIFSVSNALPPIESTALALSTIHSVGRQSGMTPARAMRAKASSGWGAGEWWMARR